MHATLQPYPGSRPNAVSAIDLRVAHLRTGDLAVAYVVHGRMNDMRFPDGAAARRADELWSHTCFELFLRARGAAAYYELNFAPSTEWAAYRFDGYRTGMEAVRDFAPPRIETEGDDLRYELRVSLNPDSLTDLPRAGRWSAAASAVIEAMDGTLSYWAIAHSPGKPDFHHPDCFVLEIPEPT
jgi:hypothetical protein